MVNEQAVKRLRGHRAEHRLLVKTGLSQIYKTLNKIVKLVIHNFFRLENLLVNFRKNNKHIFKPITVTEIIVLAKVVFLSLYV